MKRTTAVGLILIASLIWGTLGTVAAILPPGISPLAVGSSTMGIGGLLFLAVFPRRVLAVLRNRRARWWAILGGASVFIYPLAFYTSLQFAGVAVGTVVNIGSAPLFAALFELILERRRMSLRWIVGNAIGVAGLVFVAIGTNPGHTSGSASGTLFGIALALVAGSMYALYTYASRRALEHQRDAAGVMASTFGIGGLMLSPMLVLTGAPLLQSTESVLLSLYLSVIAVFLAYWIFGLALKHVSASTATTVTLIEPVIAAILAAVVVHEHISPLGWAGVAMVVIDVLAASVTFSAVRLRRITDVSASPADRHTGPQAHADTAPIQTVVAPGFGAIPSVARI